MQSAQFHMHTGRCAIGAAASRDVSVCGNVQVQTMPTSVDSMPVFRKLFFIFAECLYHQNMKPQKARIPKYSGCINVHHI